MNEKKKQIKGLLSELLPQPVSSGKELVAGDPPEVIAKMTDKGLIVAPYRAEWTTPYALKSVMSNTDLIEWNKLPEQTDLLRTFLYQKIKAASQARKATFKNCSLCKKTTSPEWMHNRDTCQTCASDKLGIVY